jgi:hypothetical protein
MSMSRRHRARVPALRSLAWLGAVMIYPLGCGGDSDADANEASRNRSSRAPLCPSTRARCSLLAR